MKKYLILKRNGDVEILEILEENTSFYKEFNLLKLKVKECTDEEEKKVIYDIIQNEKRINVLENYKGKWYKKVTSTINHQRYWRPYYYSLYPQGDSFD